MTAICPAGPPKLMKPSLSQYQKASLKVTDCGATSAVFEFIVPSSHGARGDVAAGWGARSC